MKQEKKHIGKIIESAFNQSGMTRAEFARKVGIYNQNVQRLFDSEDCSVIRLINISQATQTDFSYLFEVKDTNIDVPKIFVQIEVNEKNKNEVAKLINNKGLYDLIKK
ncbi:MAG: hypothetical protein LBS01_05040 [Prevotellaceae bacterium]|jgi:DNA-binding transcriptional regulator LsrR (DeoR family)|nr:hypothetical protein [Prevotellaceae bacterium]